MQHKNLVIVLALILAAACVILSVNLLSLYRTASYLPSESVQDIVQLLADDNIRIDPNIISTKRETGIVYVCNSGDYNRTVSELLGGSSVASSYVIPNGELLILENGARFVFSSGFAFRYDKDGTADENPNQFDLSLSAEHVSAAKKEEIAEIVVEFLDSGSREFDSNIHMSIVTVVETVWENAGKYYALCSRTIDGVAITENYALCTIDEGVVTEAYGSWSFLTLGESYSAQLSDLFNILFHVRKEITAAAQNDETVSIRSINLCYSLYFYGDEEEFCLIPCWQIVTDSMGEFIYNAIDSTLYTKN